MEGKSSTYDSSTVNLFDGDIALARRAYNTTSSVYAEHTLSNPDNEQVIYW
jgi:hypothetical protein